MNRAAPYHFLLTSCSPTISIPILHFPFFIFHFAFCISIPRFTPPAAGFGAKSFFYREIYASRRGVPLKMRNFVGILLNFGTSVQQLAVECWMESRQRWGGADGSIDNSPFAHFASLRFALHSSLPTARLAGLAEASRIASFSRALSS